MRVGEGEGEDGREGPGFISKNHNIPSLSHHPFTQLTLKKI